MSEPKVIELTEADYDIVPEGVGETVYLKKGKLSDYISAGQDILIKAPQPKLVHLSDLPDGTIVTHDGCVSYVKNGDLFRNKTASDDYWQGYEHTNKTVFELLPGEFQFWQGGKCPWPQYVEVEVCMVMADLTRECYRSEAACLDWNHTGSGQIIAHRCTGRLLDGAKLVP